jgi:hypothetical protein
MALHYNPGRAQHRRDELDQYLSANILAARCVCQHYKSCRASHPHKFYEGQLHHVGQYYDLESDGVPLRIVVVGQESGHEPARVSSRDRYERVMSAGRDRHFLAGGGYPARNPHMKGTTSALRLLFGLPLGTDYRSEDLDVDGSHCHLFDAFALVNYLLCSAVGNDGTMRGQATETMKANCRGHFREALRILEPSVVVVQGEAFWSSCVSGSFDSVTHLAHDIHEARLGASKMYVAAFAHPSAGPPKNWGANDRTPYLLGRVKPSLEWLRREALGIA